MDYELKDRVVAISGGTSGIGEELAHAFAEQGAKVAVCGRNPKKIEAIKKRFANDGLPLLACIADITQNDQLEKFAEDVVTEYGRLDAWINNAGINCRKAFWDISEPEWHDVVNTNFKATFYGCKFAAEQMKKKGGGVIINTSSFTSLTPTAGLSIYSATKGAVDNMTRCFAVELAASNIRVNSVIPGYVVTPLTEKYVEENFDRLTSLVPMKRLCLPQDLVGAYLFLASDASAYINGIALPVAGAKLCAQNPHYSWSL